MCARAHHLLGDSISLPLVYVHHAGGNMKEATFKDALRIADILDFDVDAVWDLIKGRKYTHPAELELHVCQVHAEVAPEELGL